MPRQHRSHSMQFKRQVVEEYLGGETFHGLSKRHDISRQLIRIWLEKYEAGAFDEERDNVVSIIAGNPEAGAIMPGCGGARKLRVAKPGRGKSGGYRIISFYAGEAVPTFLITVFAKGEKDNLMKAERNELSKLTKLLAAAYGK